MCDAINTAMRQLFEQIVYGRSQSAFSEGGLSVGASLEDLGKGLRSQVGTMFATKVKGPRYLEMAEGYVTRLALNKDDEIVGYEFISLGKICLLYTSSGRKSVFSTTVKAERITELGTSDEIRFLTGMGELDRVLGGGAVKGSLVLVGGAPGIGKSTLMLQICKKLGEFSKVLYVSGEESTHQLKLRAQRLRVAVSYTHLDVYKRQKGQYQH